MKLQIEKEFQNELFVVYGYTSTACLVQWLAYLTAIQEIPGSIPGYTLEIFLGV